MQLRYKLSIATATMLVGTTLCADDYVRVNFMQYSESDNRVDVFAPAIEINKDIGVDYTINGSFVSDSVSGATPIYVDTSSGASAYKSRGTVANTSNIKKENVEFTENRMNGNIGVVKRLENRDELSFSFSKSYESDFDSNTFGLGYLMWSNDSKNRSIDAGLSYQSNTILIKDCTYNSECSTADTTSGASSKETATVLSAELGITQIIDETSLVKASVYYGNENGYLSNPYYNIVRTNGNTTDIVSETRPDSKLSYGFNLKYIKAFSQTITSKFKYKYYIDDWDINSNTIDINNYYEINDKFIFGFGFRYYTQSEAEFYNESIAYFTDEVYASHDDRLSSFNSMTYKTSLDYKYSDQTSYNLSFNIYDQSTDLKTTYSSIGLKYKF